MILVFGGTTEGKNVAALLDFLGEPYFYSTRTKSNLKIKGFHLFGGKGIDEIFELCINKDVKLIIDAAHPFAEELHRNIYEAAERLGIATIRFERTYPNLKLYKNVRSFSTFNELIDELKSSNFKNILSLTGVQTIPHFADLVIERNCYFRILDTGHSRQLAKKYQIKNNFVIPAKPKESTDELISLIGNTQAEVVLSKESGKSGFFLNKVEACQKLNLPLWVVQRPELPPFHHKVNSIKTLLQKYYSLRKQFTKTEKLLKHGYTTGTCVTAAAKGCFIALVEKKIPEQVSIIIPDGETARFLIFPEELTESKASCVVIKDAGDDPDITHGKEIGCELSFTDKPGIRFMRGKGIGIVTLPGLQLKVGEPAINPVPRNMITSMLNELSGFYEIEYGFEVKPFVPEGEELAKQTFNPRVGVVDGISIIGTSGKVIPYSNKAFLSTIKYQVSVAKESGINEIVLTSGKRSENILLPFNKHLPEIAFIHFGNLIGETLQIAIENGLHKITLGVMLGKAIKLAEGHLNTHSKESLFNPEFAGELAKECGYPIEIVQEIRHLKLANAIRDIIPFSQTEPFFQEIANRCYKQCKTIIKEKADLKFILIAHDGNIITI